MTGDSIRFCAQEVLKVSSKKKQSLNITSVSIKARLSLLTEFSQIIMSAHKYNPQQKRTSKQLEEFFVDVDLSVMNGLLNQDWHHISPIFDCKHKIFSTFESAELMKEQYKNGYDIVVLKSVERSNFNEEEKERKITISSKSGRNRSTGSSLNDTLGRIKSEGFVYFDDCEIESDPLDTKWNLEGALKVPSEVSIHLTKKNAGQPKKKLQISLPPNARRSQSQRTLRVSKFARDRRHK